MSIKTAVTTLVLTGVSFIEASAAVSYTNVNVSAVSSSPAIVITVGTYDATVTYVEPRFDLSYLQPQSATSYLDVDVYAVVSKPDVIQVDVVNMLDLSTRGVGKNTTDTVVAVDASRTSFAGSLDDAVYFAENIYIQRFITRLFEEFVSTSDSSYLGFGLNKVDTVLPSDSNIFEFSKGQVDSVVALSAARADVIKALSDNASLADTSFTTYTKQVSDSITAADTFASVTNFQRTITSAVSLVDLPYALYDKGLADTATTEDFETYNFGKTTQDTTTVSDTINTETLYFRDIFDNLAFLDDQSSTFFKAITDSVGTADNQQIVMNYGLVFIDGVTMLDTFNSAIPIARTFASAVSLNEYLSKLNDATLNSFVVNGKLGGETVVVLIDRAPPPIVDLANASDSGAWALQDYNSQDYFLSDYVGTKGSI
jgi:hypothetical protein